MGTEDLESGQRAEHAAVHLAVLFHLRRDVAVVVRRIDRRECDGFRKPVIAEIARAETLQLREVLPHYRVSYPHACERVVLRERAHEQHFRETRMEFGHDVVVLQCECPVGLIEHDHRILHVLEHAEQIVVAERIAGGIVGRTDQDDRGTLLVIDPQHGRDVVFEGFLALDDRILHRNAVDLAGDGFVIPPRVRGDHDAFPLPEVTMHGLFEDVLRPVAQQHGFFLDSKILRETFGKR